MIRRLITVLSALSLLLFVATLLLWAIADRPYTPVDLKTLGWFQFDAITGVAADVPPHSRDLDGKRVTLDGFMFSTAQSGRTNAFQLVYDYHNHWGPPLVQERIFARLPAGPTVPLDGNFLRVYGTFHVNVQRADGVVQSVFDLDVDKVIDVARDLPGPVSAVTTAYHATGFFAALTAFVAMALLIEKYLRRCWRLIRPKAGICRQCGYDLRATPDRCPECGSVPDGRRKFISPQMNTDEHR
ncbi:MAG TPA: zinc ribbon domain-containing protein [Humisphaera sp.]|nr:zinc ribbon domain-containing protein [Humisphaera sp.]